MVLRLRAADTLEVKLLQFCFHFLFVFFFNDGCLLWNKIFMDPFWTDFCFLSPPGLWKPHLCPAEVRFTELFINLIRFI